MAKFKEKVREPQLSITDAIYEAGFGSSSRAYEGSPMGMTPSAMKAGGKGELIRYTTTDSPLGRLLVAATSRGVCAVALADSDDELVGELQERFNHAELKRMDAELTREVSAVIGLLGENPTAVALPLDVRMTAFQQRVWNALIAIPRGTLKTYGELAAELGNPKGAIAVGQAVAKIRSRSWCRVIAWWAATVA